ncbi:MAG: hypothetical protein WA666_12245 [Nitrospirota bacterium]
MRKLVFIALLVVLLFINAINAMCADMELKSDTISKNLKNSNREEIAKFIYETASRGIDDDKVKALIKLLDDKGFVLTHDSYYSSAKIQVRDIAFTCLVEMTEEFFLDKNQIPGKEIITYFSKDGPTRFTIPLMTEEEYALAKNNIKYWFKGYDEGIKERLHL